jgi:hypothetical protein
LALIMLLRSAEIGQNLGQKSLDLTQGNLL